MNTYCNILTLDIPPLIEEFDITNLTTQQMSVIDIHNINPKIKELLFNLGINVSCIHLFYKKPGNGRIHADYLPDNLSKDFTKINWIYKGKNSRMVWFTINDPLIKKEIKLTNISAEYLQYSPNEVTQVHSVNILGPALVQVGTPHSIINPSEDRYCLCFIITDLHGNRLTMHEAQKLLDAYILKHT
jgi:hypothetical protein